jgi:hypothetical protein
VPAPDEPSILGFPAEFAGDETAPEDEVPLPPLEALDGAGALYVLHTGDAYAGTLLMVAGTAGGMSLFLPWVQHDRELGLALVRRSLESGNLDGLERSGLLLPLVVAGAACVLFVLGLLAFRPARTHRLVGVAALVVSLGVATGIVVRVADGGWDPLRTDPGALCAVVLAGCGVLGALKAMLTPPEVSADPR